MIRKVIVTFNLEGDDSPEEDSINIYESLLKELIDYQFSFFKLERVGELDQILDSTERNEL